MAKFYITANRYIQQVGQSEPRMVGANPGAPTLVELPDFDAEGKPMAEKYKKDRGLIPADSGEPPRLVSHYVDPQKAPVPKAADVQGKPAKERAKERLEK